MFTGRDPAGGDVVLTLDPAVQEAAMAGLEGVTGAVVALDPSSGAILGMASTPSYDPTRLSSHDPADIRAYWDELEAAAPDPRLNRAIGDDYPPGSLFKVIVSAAALRGRLHAGDRHPGARRAHAAGTNTTLRNFGNSRCNSSQEQPLIDALTVSCNTAFAQLGIDLGEDRVREMAEAFGLDGEGYEIPLDVAPSGVGDIESDAAARARPPSDSATSA